MRTRLALCLGALALVASGIRAADVTIVSPRGASAMERLAAREVRRYLYLRTGRLAGMSAALPAKGDTVVLSRTRAPGLKAQEYRLETSIRRGRRVLTISAGDPAGTLYGAYRFAEALGVRFYLHGDVIPDARIPLAVPVLHEVGRPLFALRGIQPFHDFPEGPDWWSEDGYRAVIGQLPKLRMNFIGLHTYPEPIAEPAVWIGTPGDIGANGRVKTGYPAAWFNTALTTWGYEAKRTSDYAFGASLLYDRDDYGDDVMRGLTPRPVTGAQQADVFNRAAAMLKAAFSDARALGVKTCIGTETPLTVPSEVQARLRAAGKDPADPKVVGELYRGMFLRLMSACPVDYYWLWTPEGWTWQGASGEQVAATLRDLRLAGEAAKAVKAPFRMATCGWVLGPQDGRALLDEELPAGWSLSAINRSVGMAPVEPGFADVKNHDAWAIPWLEDDPGLTAPQLWAGRMRADAVDALRYGCDGLMGIHWRTRVMAPNVGALAHAAWDQSWRHAMPSQVDYTDGQTSSFPGAKIADTADEPLYRDVRYDMSAYRLKIPNGTYTVSLQFCEPFYDAAGKRAFDVSIQGRKVIDNLDVFARVGKDRALDLSFSGVRVTGGRLDITFGKRIEYPCIAAISVEGVGFTRKINCGGPVYKDYEADIQPAPRDQPSGDFYQDWAGAEFGPEVGAEAGRLFASLDGRLPRPVGWIGGPGGLGPDDRDWRDVQKDYAFVNAFSALAPRVKGAGARERFGYWEAQFRYLRATARLACDWGAYNRALKEAMGIASVSAREKVARTGALRLRAAMVIDLREVYVQMLRFVSNTGEMGTVTNWEQHILPGMLDGSVKDLAAATGEPLPPEAYPGTAYTGTLRVFVPVARTSFRAGERLAIQATVLSAAAPKSVTLQWRSMGKGTWRSIPARHAARGVYRFELPSASEDFEYYVKATDASGKTAVWPATAPGISQTVVRTES